MIYTSRFLITGLKRINPKINLTKFLQRGSINITKKFPVQENSTIDFKSLFSRLPKSACKDTKMKFLTGNPRVSFYSEDFIDKVLAIFKSKGCDIWSGNPNKIPRFLYHLTTKSNYENMLKSGFINPAKEGLCGENIFMLDIQNFFKRWTKFNPVGGSHQKRLLFKVSGINKEDIVILKIPTEQLNRNKLGIRSQDVLFSNVEHLGTEQLDFMKKFNCTSEDELLQLLETDENTFNQFANIFKKYLHLTKGTCAGNQRLFTTRKDAIEYIYPEKISVKNIRKIGQINPNDFELTTEFDPSKPMQSTLKKLLSGQPEEKGTLLVQG